MLAHDLEERASPLRDVGRVPERVDEREAVGRIEPTRLHEQQQQLHEAVPLLDLDFRRRRFADRTDRNRSELFRCHVAPYFAGAPEPFDPEPPQHPRKVYREKARFRSTGRRTLSE